MKSLMKKSPKQPTQAHPLTSADWRAIYEALMDSAELHHAGPRAERCLALARRIREDHQL